MKGRPLVSIIVPSFNQGEYIAKTLDSILTQSYRPLEVIVVDGASTDNTVGILKEYAEQHDELRWLSEPDDGVASAVNKGLARASGEICAIQSSDDLYYAGAVEHAVSVLQSHPECGFVYGDSDSINGDDCIISHYRVPEFSWEALFGISLCLPQQSIFFRMALARQIGGWNSKYYGCDLDYWMRLLLQAPAVKTDYVFSAWRVHTEQRTQLSQSKQIWDGYWQMIEDSEALKKAPRRLRRLAFASRHIMAFRFPPTGNLWALRWHALVAFCLFPGFVHFVPKSRLRTLIPGYVPLQRLYRGSKLQGKQTQGPCVKPGGPRPESIVK